MRSFKERYGPWALVTGASAGIGAEFARQLAARGLNLVLVARRKDRLDRLSAELSDRQGVRVKTVSIDLAAPDFLSSIRTATEDLDIGLLVNNAGFGLAGRLTDHDLETDLNLLHVNCSAVFGLAHEYGRWMKARGKGGIVFVSSILGFFSAPFHTHYAASKAYDLFLAEGMWYEMRKYGVDVLALCPGVTETEFHDVAGTKQIGAMPVEPVVDLALRKLGRKHFVIPGLKNRAIVFLAKMLPRRLTVCLVGRGMGKFLATDGPTGTAVRT